MFINTARLSALLLLPTKFSESSRSSRVPEIAATSKANAFEVASSTVFIYTVKLMDSRMVEILEHACFVTYSSYVLLDEFELRIERLFIRADSVGNRFMIVDTTSEFLWRKFARLSPCIFLLLSVSFSIR